jgi:hypothetical protein
VEGNIKGLIDNRLKGTPAQPQRKITTSQNNCKYNQNIISPNQLLQKEVQTYQNSLFKHALDPIVAHFSQSNGFLKT